MGEGKVDQFSLFDPGAGGGGIQVLEPPHEERTNERQHRHCLEGFEQGAQFL